MSKRVPPPIATLQPPVWAGSAPASETAVVDRHVPGVASPAPARAPPRRRARRQARPGRARRRREAAAAILERPRFRRAWAAIEYTETFLVAERVGDGEAHHDPTLCYLCDPTATLGLALPRAVAYATAALFQIENGEHADAEFFADWDEFRRERGRPRRTDRRGRRRRRRRATICWPFSRGSSTAVCFDYALPHVRQWQATELGRTDVDRLVADLTIEAERYWLADGSLGKTRKNGFNSTRL